MPRGTHKRGEQAVWYLRMRPDLQAQKRVARIRHRPVPSCEVDARQFCESQEEAVSKTEPGKTITDLTDMVDKYLQQGAHKPKPVPTVVSVRVKVPDWVPDEEAEAWANQQAANDSYYNR